MIPVLEENERNYNQIAKDFEQVKAYDVIWRWWLNLMKNSKLKFIFTWKIKEKY